MQRWVSMTILGTLLTAITAKADINKEAFLSAIRQVETGDVHSAIGKSGERGAYQLTRQTWAMHSKYTHKSAHNPDHALIVAFAHLDWLIARVGTDPVKLAIAWNGGLGAVKNPSKRQKDYARRVNNLYEETV